MRILKILIPVVLVILIGIQFIPDRMPENKPVNENHIAGSGLITGDIESILKASCFDCHSDQTRFPWYARIAPSSWLLADHIREGRSELNFSEWETYSKQKKIGLLDAIKEEVTSGEMPLKSYTLIHRHARLKPGQISIIENWTEEATEKLMEQN